MCRISLEAIAVSVPQIVVLQCKIVVSYEVTKRVDYLSRINLLLDSRLSTMIRLIWSAGMDRNRQVSGLKTLDE